MDYTILRNTDEYVLKERVTNLLYAGWELYGPLIVANNRKDNLVFIQALTKK